MIKNLQAIILAAGKGKRFQPLTNGRPKPLLKVLNKTILEYNLDQLNNLLKEVVLVVGYQGEKVKNLIGESYKNLKIKYVFQKAQLGTGNAAKKALSLIGDKFLLLNGDDLYDREDIKKCLKKYPCILLARAKNLSNFGIVSCEGKFVKGIIEKPKEPADNLVNTGLYFLPKSIFNFKIKKSPRGEYEFTDYLGEFIKKEKLFFIKAKNWKSLSYPWDLFEVNEFLLKREKGIREGKVEKNSQIKGKIIIEKGTLIKSGSYLQGPIYIGKNSQIGPNCYIRGPVSIGENCVLGQAVEIKNSIIGANAKIFHLSYVGDSIIGENCNLGAGTITANLRFDQKTIKLITDGKLVDTKRKKFGCILGDNVEAGINVSIMPGVLIGSDCLIYPNSLVKRNIKDKEIFK
ncbi:MAG: NTP transferase domain-containing protein [Candidatus Pacebacteria bacterium]|nr:NTP transferase domain-containing protein [Candidatus Paceibacterota bacterium]